MVSYVLDALEALPLKRVVDVVSHFDTLRIGIAYDSLGERYEEFPRQQRVLYNCAPVYEDHEGWSTDITEIRDFDDLPKAAQRYVERIEEIAGVPVTSVGVGPDRDATLKRNP